MSDTHDLLTLAMIAAQEAAHADGEPGGAEGEIAALRKLAEDPEALAQFLKDEDDDTAVLDDNFETVQPALIESRESPRNDTQLTRILEQLTEFLSRPQPQPIFNVPQPEIHIDVHPSAVRVPVTVKPAAVTVRPPAVNVTVQKIGGKITYGPDGKPDGISPES